MSKLLQTKRIRLTLLAVVATLALAASYGGLVLLRGQAAAARGSVEAARARWAGRGFDAYTLTLRQENRDKICDQQIAIQAEQATQALRNNCGQPPNWTVSRLLDWVVELERTPSRCYPGPAACACQVTASTSVRYDEELGYPRTIVYEWHSRPNLLNPAYWRTLTDRSFPGCSNIQASGAGGTLIVNVGLEPEP